MRKIKFIDHTADIAAEISGDSLEELFRAGFEAYMESILEESEIKKEEQQSVNVSADSREELLVNFLNELNFLTLTKKWLPAAIDELNITSNSGIHQLMGILEGESFDETKHEFSIEIKSVTYHQMEIVSESGVYRTTVVFDI
jgi:SHS2 domain-containing protein